MLLYKQKSELCMKTILGILLLFSVSLYADMSTTKNAMNEYRKGNYDKAVKLLAKSCKDDEINACVNLGYMYVHGLSIEKSFTKGYGLLKKACDSGNNKGCIVLGNAILEEEANLWYNFQKTKNPTLKDEKEHQKRLDVGMNYLKKACDDKSAVGCKSLGSAYWNFIQQNGGIKKLPKLANKAFDTLTKACDLKDIGTCVDLGYTYENLGEKYFGKASAIYKKACDFGYKKACNDYKRLRGSGY